MERLYGIRNGGERKSDPNKCDLVGQEDIAKQMKMSVDTLDRYKKLSEMIPELSELVDTGTVTKTTALAIMEISSDHEQLLLNDP